MNITTPDYAAVNTVTNYDVRRCLGKAKVYLEAGHLDMANLYTKSALEHISRANTTLESKSNVVLMSDYRH